MSQTIDIKKSIVALVALVMVCTTFAAVMADDSDAEESITGVNIGSIKEVKEFKEHKDGTISVNISNSIGVAVNVTLMVMDGTTSVADAEVKVAAQSSVTKEISFQVSSGNHTIVVTASGVTDDQEKTDVDIKQTLTLNISCSKSIWSGWMPYVALVIVALICVLMIYIWVRGRPKKAKGVTFNDLEEGKIPEQPQQASDTSMKKYESAPKSEAKPEKSTGRMKYVSDRRK